MLIHRCLGQLVVEYLFMLCMAEAGAHCGVMRVMQQATLLEIVLVDVEIVEVTGVVIEATLGRSKLTFVLRWTFRLKMMWARSVRLLTMSLKWMK